MAFANIIDAATAVDDIHSLRSLVVSPRESISSYALARLMILALLLTTCVLPPSSTTTTTSTQYHSPPPLRSSPPMSISPPSRTTDPFPLLYNDFHSSRDSGLNQRPLPSQLPCASPPLHHFFSPLADIDNISQASSTLFSTFVADLLSFLSTLNPRVHHNTRSDIRKLEGALVQFAYTHANDGYACI